MTIPSPSSRCRTQRQEHGVGGDVVARVLDSLFALALAGAELEVREPPLERLLPEPAIPPELDMRNAAGARLCPDPVLRDAETLGDFLDGEQAGHAPQAAENSTWAKT